MSLSVTLGRPHPEHARIDSGILEPVQESSMKGCRSSGYMLRMRMEDTQSKEGKVHGNTLCTLLSVRPPIRPLYFLEPPASYAVT